MQNAMLPSEINIVGHQGCCEEKWAQIKAELNAKFNDYKQQLLLPKSI